MNTIWIVVDIEADGQVPGLYSMICFGAVAIIDEKIYDNFYGTLKPISDDYDEESLSVSGFTRDECLQFEDPKITMELFNDWVKKFDGKVKFLSDNNGFDWSFINYYFHKYIGSNPFGYSSRRIGDIYSGLCSDLNAKYNHLIETPHTHNPLDDATGEAEAFIKILKMIKQQNKTV